MTHIPRRAVVTGTGAESALGSGVPAFWAGLRAGRCALGPLRSIDTTGIVKPFGGEVPDPAPPVDPLHPPDEILDPAAWSSIFRLTNERGLDALDRAQRHLLRATREALVSSRLDPAAIDRSRLAVVVGTTLGGMRIGESWIAARAGGREGDADRLCDVPYFATATRLARTLGARGPVRSPSLACASGTAALVTALDMIRRDRADVVLAGGAEALSRFVVAGFDCLRATTATSVRPFDARRDGLLLGEGAAIVVVESLAHARARGLEPEIELAGGGLAADAVHMTAPARDGDGAARAMAAALADAGTSPEAIDFVSSHGTGTVFNDAMEVHAIGRVLGARANCVAVNSIKGTIGHTLAVAGTLEAILCCEVLRSGLVPPTAGCEELDPACTLDVVRGAARPVEARVVLSTSSAFAGHNAAIVLRRGVES